MHAGIAYCNSKAAFAAGRYLANTSSKAAGTTNVQVLLLFCNAATDYQRLLDGARSICGSDTLILGGSAVGVITNHSHHLAGYPAAALALGCDDNGVKFQSAFVENLGKDPYLAGSQLGKQFSNADNVFAKLLLLFYDSVRYPGSSTSAAILNPSLPLLAGLYEALPQQIPIAGAGLLANLQFEATTQFFQQHAKSQLATGLLISGNVKPYICAMHGCSPINQQLYTVTGIFQQFLYTLDHKPVTQVLDQLSGSKSWRQQFPVTQLALGASFPLQQNHYSTSFVTRLISGCLPNDEGVILFEPDFYEGMQIQIMQRDQASILHATDQQTQQILQQIIDDEHQPIVALYFDCAGRISELAAETKIIQRHLNAAGIPLLGIYTGVEIAPVGAISRSLDWSGVLVILTQPLTK